MNASLFRNRDFRLVAGSVGLSALGLGRAPGRPGRGDEAARLGAFAAGGLLVATIGARGTLAYAGGLSALAGIIGVLVLLRMYRGWVPTGPVQPAE